MSKRSIRKRRHRSDFGIGSPMDGAANVGRKQAHKHSPKDRAANIVVRRLADLDAFNSSRSPCLGLVTDDVDPAKNGLYERRQRVTRDARSGRVVESVSTYWERAT